MNALEKVTLNSINYKMKIKDITGLKKMLVTLEGLETKGKISTEFKDEQTTRINAFLEANPETPEDPSTEV